MRTNIWFGFLSVLAAALVALSCSTSASRNNLSVIHDRASNSPSAVSAPTPISPIRELDFDNITYRNFPDYSDPNGRKKKYVTLKPGQGGPNYINYGDITGDRQEDAMVALEVDNHGSAIP